MTTRLTVLAICLICLPARADSILDLALKGGLNSSVLEHDNRVGRYGFSGGVAGHLSVASIDRFSLAGQLEMLYTPRGANVVFEGESLGGSREHYMDIVLAARPTVQLGRVGIYLLLGGGLNVLLTANKHDAMGTEQNITDDLHRLDVSLLGGVGVAATLSSGDSSSFHLDTVFLEARHDIGFLEVDAVNGGYKNRTSSLMLGVSFALGGRVASEPPSHEVAGK